MAIEVRDDDGQRIYSVTSGRDRIGFIVVDRAIAGRARGGLRLLADLGEPEIRAAARNMTLKYGWLGLPQGGAKAGVIGVADGTVDERRARLVTFAREARAVLAERIYVPDSDLGTSAADIRHMMEAVDLPGGPHEWRGGRSGFFTAVSCLAAAGAALERHGRSFKDCRVGIEGFGRVGASLAGLLVSRGAVVVAVSTSHGAVHDPSGLDVAALRTSAASTGSRFVNDVPADRRIERARLLELDVDLLCPCARSHSIDVSNVDRVRAPVICSGANNPISPDAEARLHARGTLVVPDFVSNAGGVLGGTMDYAAMDEDTIASVIESHIRADTTELIDRAARSGDRPSAVARREALRRFELVCERAGRHTLAGRCLTIGLDAYRRGAIPRAAMRLLAPSFFRRHLASLGWTVQ